MAREHEEDETRDVGVDMMSNREESDVGVRESLELFNQRLDVIESHTRQTNLDLEELYIRLKNNNYYLNE